MHRRSTFSRRRVVKWALAAGATGIGMPFISPRSAWSTQDNRQAPDIILYNARIYTVDPKDSTASAIAIKDDTIVAVGDDSTILDLGHRATRKFDLEDRTVTPGFIDAHPHLNGVGYRLLRTDWGKLHSIDDILNVIARVLATVNSGEWLVLPPLAGPPELHGFPAQLREGRWPNRDDIDKVSPDNPVYIEPHFLGIPGVAIANSLALETARLISSDVSPRGVRIERDADARPTGVFIDYNYPRALPVQSWPMRPENFPQIPRISDPQAAARHLRKGIEAFNEAGLTAIYEGHGMSERVIDAYRDIYDAGELTLRAYLPLSFPFSGYEDEAAAEEAIARAIEIGPGNGIGDDYLKIGGLGFSFDSAAASAASLMREPYVNPKGGTWRGLQLTSDDNLRRAFEKAARAGLRVQAQCSGGAAIDKVLELFSDIDKEIPLKGKRWVIEHCQFPSAENMETCRRLGVVPTSAVAFLWNFGKTYIDYFGREVADRAMPYRSWLEAGVPICNSTDGEPYDPMLNFWEMLARKDGFTGQTLGPQEKLPRAQALRTYTMNPAYATFWEDRIGSIEPGKLADLAILSQDIMTVPEDDIPDTQVVATLVGGRPVHDVGLFGSL